MRGAERSAGNTAKNIALIVLAALMAVLCAANWLAGVSAASLGSDNPLRRVHDRLFGGATGYEIRSSGVSAASPAQLALGASGELVGVQYSTTDVDASLGAVRSIWTQALSGDALMETDEQTLAGELGAERKVLLRYHGALPLSVVSGWMGGTLADDRIKVETLFYSADSGTLFVRTPDGALYLSHAEADRGAFDRALEDFHGTDCAFAGADTNVYPETLLFEGENLTLPVLKNEALDLFAAQSVRLFRLHRFLRRAERHGARIRGRREHAAARKDRADAVRDDRRPEHGDGVRERRGHRLGRARRADRLRARHSRHGAARRRDRHPCVALCRERDRAQDDAGLFAAVQRCPRAREHGFCSI